MEYQPTTSSIDNDGRDLEQLSKILKEDTNELREWAKSMPPLFNYNTFHIPKRSGKYRTINSPNKDLKSLQKKIYKNLLKNEAIPTTSTGFVTKRSIVDNAKPHVNSKIIIKIDLKDFFYSIKENRVYRYWIGCNWNKESAVILTNICCKDGYLPQGSPTSPALSNVVNRVFDGFILTIVNKIGARYTRYADDITISFPDKVKKAEFKVKLLIKDLKALLKREKYEIQYEKGIKVLRSHQRQIVTGLVVNDGISIPREKRRLLRSMRHKAKLGLLADTELKKLEGYELFYNMVEKGHQSTNLKNKLKSKNSEDTKSKNIEINISSGGQIIMSTGDGDFILGGDKITAGDNYSGIQNVGKFQNVVSNLTESGHKELADAILQLTQSIVNSESLSPKDKEDHSDALKKIGEEVTKEKPDKTILKYMWEGLSTALKAVPDIAKAVATVAPLIAPFFM